MSILFFNILLVIGISANIKQTLTLYIYINLKDSIYFIVDLAVKSENYSPSNYSFELCLIEQYAWSGKDDRNIHI